MEVVRLDAVGEQQWDELIAGEPQPWGGGIAERLSWGAKTHNVGVRARDGRLLAVAGAVLAHVAVQGAGRFDVLGIGGLFVTREVRGRGLVAQLLDGLLGGANAARTAVAVRAANAVRTAAAATTEDDAGPERAMLFCREQLVAVYRKFDFREIADPVWAEQPGGVVRVPLRAMWRALRAGATWPAGRVDVLGLPF